MERRFNARFIRAEGRMVQDLMFPKRIVPLPRYLETLQASGFPCG